MCGFVGAFDASIPRHDVAAALDVLAHRGPDGRQVAETGPLSLGSCRLAIVPPKQAPAIYTSPQGWVLALNGEIYGFQSLANVPADATEAEALGLLISEQGPSVLSELDGLFAFCFFDGDCLLLARDRFGIKPLYYAHHRGSLVFASEMKAILALSGFSREPDEDVMSAFMVVGHNVFPGRTPFRAIRALRPGHFLECRAGSGTRELPFAEVACAPIPGEGRHIDPELLEEQVEGLLTASTRAAVTHDPNPKALFFSGGLDSSLLLDIARGEGEVTAFVLSDREDADDLLEARRVAAALEVSLHEQPIDELDLAREIVHYAWHFEHPIAGGAFDLFGGVAFHALARTIGREFRVALCGEGADELFLGYHRLHMEPRLAAATIAESARKHATPELREWLGEQGLDAPGPKTPRALRNLALHQGLCEYHLPSVDRSGMAFGLEVRPPYLDNGLTDLVASLDEACLIDRGERWTKLPLRGIARRRLQHPQAQRVAVRRKRAMPTAVERAEARLGELLLGPQQDRDPNATLERLLSDLFFYLHVDPGLAAPPDFSLLDFAAETGVRMAQR